MNVKAFLQMCTEKYMWANYHPQRSWGKGIFSEACVKNSVHGGGGVWADPPGAVHAGRYWQQAGSTHTTGM